MMYASRIFANIVGQILEDGFQIWPEAGQCVHTVSFIIEFQDGRTVTKVGGCQCYFIGLCVVIADGFEGIESIW